MEALLFILFGLFFVILFVMMGGVTLDFLKYAWGSINSFFFIVNDSKVSRDYLEQYFHFYRRLPDKSKYLFRKRVRFFIASKNFIPRNIPAVTREMKTLIAASAIQLTFGFPRVYLSYFVNILIYPDNYYSTISKRYHKGEVNPRLRAIVLSWKSFIEGYVIPKDGRNLGLHEMAHALRLEDKIINEEYRFLDKEVLKAWELRAARTIQEIKDGRETFFRAYGGTDADEFFAVAVENFFERPTAFSTHHPLAYQTLCQLLKQNPLLLNKTSTSP